MVCRFAPLLICGLIGPDSGLQENQIGDAGCNYFRAAIEGCRRLALLNLRYNNISENACKGLEAELRAKVLI